MSKPIVPELPEFAGILEGRFDIVPIELRDCPVFLASAIPCHPDVTGQRIRVPAGRGLTARDAIVSAAAESVELLSSLASSADLATLPVEMREGFAHLPVRSLGDGAAAAMPAQSLYLDWAECFDEPVQTQADSTGCAAGKSLEDAVERALFECIERDACAAWWYGRQSRRHVAISALRRTDPRLTWWLDNRARRTVLIDIASDIAIPVMVAASAESDSRHVAIGVAAGRTARQAAISAVTEMVQTEVAMRAGRSPDNAELENWIAAATLVGMRQFTPLEKDQELPADMEASPLRRVLDGGFDVLAYEYPRLGPGLVAVRCIVSGFSAMHGRGVDSRILKLVQDHPEYGGAGTAAEFETLEPY